MRILITAILLLSLATVSQAKDLATATKVVAKSTHKVAKATQAHKGLKQVAIHSIYPERVVVPIVVPLAKVAYKWTGLKRYVNDF